MQEEPNPGSAESAAPSENAFPKALRYILGGVVAVGAALAVDALLIEPARVEVTEHELPITGLPAAWDGASVVHLSDLHYGNPRSRRLLSWMVRTVNDLEPDLILITGDYVVRQSAEMSGCAHYLSQLRSRRGIFGIFGDHDYVCRTQALHPGMVELVTGAGVRLLRNESVELPGGLLLSGTDANTSKVRKGDLPTALAGLNGARPHIHLAHSPDIITQASKFGLPVVLCGHTHGGQVVVPGYGAPVTHTRVSNEFASGWSQLGETRMYTSRGLSSHYSLRFWCRPEISLFRLRCAP